jgi:hypothetical protein
MAKQTDPDLSRLADGEELFEPIEDERGRLRLDRRLTPEEAAAQDEANRAAWLQDRRARFGGSSTTTEGGDASTETGSGKQ